jgi:hypothetical protein
LPSSHLHRVVKLIFLVANPDPHLSNDLNPTGSGSTTLILKQRLCINKKEKEVHSPIRRSLATEDTQFHFSTDIGYGTGTSIKGTIRPDWI